MKSRFIIVAFGFLLMSCSSTKITPEQIKELKSAVAQNNFEIVSTSAMPVVLANVAGIQRLLPPGSNVADVEITATTNYFRVQNDSISVVLPYYGEHQQLRGTNTDIGISFEGTPQEVKVRYDEKKNKYLINYTIKTRDELLRVLLTLFANKTAFIDLNSSHRTAISYSGSWELIDE